MVVFYQGNWNTFTVEVVKSVSYSSTRDRPVLTSTSRKFGSVSPTWKMLKLFFYFGIKNDGSSERKNLKVGQKDRSAAHQRQMDYFSILQREVQ